MSIKRNNSMETAQLFNSVVPNRGSQLAFLRLLLTFENPTKIFKKSIYYKKMKFKFKN